MELKNIYNDLENTKLQVFLQDEVLQEVVKKAVLFHSLYEGVLVPGVNADPMRNIAFFYVNGPSGVEERTDQQIATNLRVAKEAIFILERAFNSLKELKKSETVDLPKVNKAR